MDIYTLTALLNLYKCIIGIVCIIALLIVLKITNNAITNHYKFREQEHKIKDLELEISLLKLSKTYK